MHPSLSAKGANATRKAALLLACLAWSGGSAALAGTGGAADSGSYLPSAERPKEELFLEVYVNNFRTNKITRFKRYRSGCLAILPEDLKEYKLKASAAALHSGGGYCLDLLPGVSSRYEARTQSIYLTVTDEARETMFLDARGRGPETTAGEQKADWSAVFNYALFANFATDDLRAIPSYKGVSATVDAHLFSAYGGLDQSLSARSTVDEIEPNLLRLDSRWYYNDDGKLVTYAAGDIISGALNWTRAIRLGGVQIRRDFALRPDLVTQPVPQFSGSAAVPSTVEIYANQNRAFSQEIGGGPFTVTNVPVISGPGTMRLVVRDASGRETVSEYAYYASPRLLAPGFYDYSVEGGFARTFYGVLSNSYDENPIASASLRYGVTNRLTLEGHAEGGAGLANIGAGAVFGLWRYGIASLAASASEKSGDFGGQVSGSIETSVWGARLFARSLRSLADYQDLAAVTAPKERLRELFGPSIAARSGAVYNRQDQVSVSVPLDFDKGSLTFSYTDAEDAAKNSYKIGSVSYSRPAFWQNSTLFVNGFNDFDRTNSWGVFAGLTFSWDKMSASALSQASANSYSAGGYLSRTLGQEAGSYGYNIRAQEGTLPVNSASVSYRASAVKLDAGIQQIGKSGQVSAQAEGAVAFMNGFFLSNRIDNSFAVVDTAVPGVTVLYENHPVGETDSAGRILIPSLRAREQNSITIDPASVPVQADMEVMKQVVMPAQRGGVSVHFKGNAAPPSALAVFKNDKGQVLPPGSEVWVNGASESFVIGYDGETYLTNLAASNVAQVKLPDGTPCSASFEFAASSDGQTRIDNVVCTADTTTLVASASGATVKLKQ